MRQLVQLHGHADEFKQLNCELVFIFREEREGIEGLQKIREKHGTDFRFGVDLNNKVTTAYSPEPMTFDNYVIDSEGIVRGIVAGTKTDRATAEELMKILKQIQDDA